MNSTIKLDDALKLVPLKLLEKLAELCIIAPITILTHPFAGMYRNTFPTELHSLFKLALRQYPIEPILSFNESKV